MSKFTFETDAQAEAYCARIAQQMVQFFGIAEDEAIGRINRHFRGRRLVGEDASHRVMLYREYPDWWAKNIFYPDDSFWWQGEEGLKPKPYP